MRPLLSRTWNAALAAAAYGLVTLPAYAQTNDVFGEIPDVGGTGGTDEQGIRDTVISLLTTVLNFMALVAVIFIIIAGIRLVVSQGSEEERDKAKKTIIYVVVGLIVILLARTIVGFIADTIAPQV